MLRCIIMLKVIEMENETYRALGKTVKKIGKDTLDVIESLWYLGGFVVSAATPIVPGDIQKKIERNTHISTSVQMLFSGLSETAASLVLYLKDPTNGYGTLTFAAEGLYRALVGYVELRLNDPDHSNNFAAASIVVEKPYQIGKNVYDYLENTYAESKREIKLESRKR